MQVQNIMPNGKIYDLEERTFQFVKAFALYAKQFPLTLTNIEYIKQGSRATGSPSANYIEANESLSKKDFQMRIKICRKEAKESAYWIRVLVETNDKQYQKPGLELF